MKEERKEIDSLLFCFTLCFYDKQVPLVAGKIGTMTGRTLLCIIGHNLQLSQDSFGCADILSHLTFHTVSISRNRFIESSLCNTGCLLRDEEGDKMAMRSLNAACEKTD